MRRVARRLPSGPWVGRGTPGPPLPVGGPRAAAGVGGPTPGVEGRWRVAEVGGTDRVAHGPSVGVEGESPFRARWRAGESASTGRPAQVAGSHERTHLRTVGLVKELTSPRDLREEAMRDAVIVDAVRTPSGEGEGHRLAGLGPPRRPAGHPAGGPGRAQRPRRRADRRRGRRHGEPGRRAGLQRRPPGGAGRRLPRAGAGHHRRPPVRVVAAGDLLRRPGRAGRRLRPRHRRRGGVDEPGADGLARRRGVGPRRRAASPSATPRGWSARAWPPS